MAFVSSFTPVSIGSRPVSLAARVSRVAVNVAPRRAAPRMVDDVTDKVKEDRETFSNLEADRVAKQESAATGPQGFTPYAERINGRAAQIGFFSALLIEIFTGKSIVDQIRFVLSPITKLLNID